MTENAKTVCKEGEAYDASDLKVYAVLKNGVKKDVTDYVTIDDTALTADDDFVTVTYKYGMYRDKTNEGAANTTGVAVSPVETTINVTVLAAEDYDSVKAVEKLISDLGEITLDSENDIKAARAAYDALGDLKEYVGIKKTIKDYGVDEKYFLDTLDQMTEDAFDDQCTGANPRLPLMSEIKDMYLRAYYGK